MLNCFVLNLNEPYSKDARVLKAANGEGMNKLTVRKLLF